MKVNSFIIRFATLLLLGLVFSNQGESKLLDQDIAKIAEEAMHSHEKCPRQGCEDQEFLEHDESLFLLISFSMPEEALRFFSKELELYGGCFVLRGIPNNSFPEFFKKVKHLREIGIDGPFSIDPDLFEAYSDEGVPTLLLMSEEEVDKVTGNVPIRDSLEKILYSGDNKQLAKDKLFSRQ